MGGAVSRVAPDATAFAGRDAAHLININAAWTDPAEDGEHISWAREFLAATEPFSTGGVYVNFLGNEGEARVRATYGATYARLAETKRRYDPENIFRFNQNIVPASLARPDPGARWGGPAALGPHGSLAGCGGQ